MLDHFHAFSLAAPWDPCVCGEEATEVCEECGLAVCETCKRKDNDDARLPDHV